MSRASAVGLETRFMLRDRAVLTWLGVALLLSTFAVWSGLAEVRQQRDSIAFLLEADRKDRMAEFSKQGDWGSAAYYSFHLTYAPPSDFAFAAMGQRDAASWKHRVRMLALEGQIYEHDPGNPALALIGRFDFAFLAAIVIPLVLIVLLHDLQAAERRAGRHYLLLASAAGTGSLWRCRGFARASALLVATCVPLLVGGAVSGAPPVTLATAVGLVLLYTVFWTLVCLWFAARQQSAATILASLVGVWVLLSTVLPAGSRAVVDRMVPIPSGADILMTQREAVNDAWDLPVEDTMRPFTERHPQWTGYAYTGDGFDWGWYYAFQQVGDQRAEALSNAFMTGRRERDRLTGLLAIATPPAFLERQLQRLAGTDTQSVLDYEVRVREFHAELRAFYYPGLFGDAPFSPEMLSELPEFSPVVD
ncbi:MAG: DUF3526 domain-containing protein [Pseudomonadota bacterium]